MLLKKVGKQVMPAAERQFMVDDGFFLPNSRALLPTVHTNCPDGVSLCPDFHPQPLFFTQPPHTPLGDMYVHQTPPHLTPKDPFLKTAPRPAPPRLAPALRLLPPTCVVLSVGKCSPSGLLTPAERPRESGSAIAAVRERHRICDCVNVAA